MRIEGGVSDLLCSHWLQIFLTLTPQTTNFGIEKFIKYSLRDEILREYEEKKLCKRKQVAKFISNTLVQAGISRNWTNSII
jgi:hypothetical protein